MRSRFVSWSAVVALGLLASGAAFLGSLSQPTSRSLLRAAVEATDASGFVVAFGGPQHPLTAIVDQGREELVSQGTVIAYFTSPDLPLDSLQGQIPFTTDFLVPAQCGTSLQFLRGAYLLKAELSAAQLATDPVSAGGGGFILTTGRSTRLQISVRNGLITRLTDLREIAGLAAPERVERFVQVGGVPPIDLPKSNDVLPSSEDGTQLGDCVGSTLPPDFTPF